MELPPPLSCALYAAAFALGFPLNVLALRGAWAPARRRLTPSLVYALHLGCADLLLALTLPLRAAEALAAGRWALPRGLCAAFALAHLAPLHAAGGFLAALSAGRFLGAAFPLGYQALRRPRYSRGVCVCVWALALGPLGLLLGLEPPGAAAANASRACLDAWAPAAPARLGASVLLCLVPLGVAALSYAGCLRALARSGLSRRRKLRAAWLAGGALLSLLLGLGPCLAAHLADLLHPARGGPWRRLGLLTGAWSVVLNPLVTGYLGAGPRRATVGLPRTQAGPPPEVAAPQSTPRRCCESAEKRGGQSSVEASVMRSCDRKVEAQEQVTVALLAVVLPVCLTAFWGAPAHHQLRLVWLLGGGGGGSRRRRTRVWGLLAATLLNFLVCFGPYNVSHVVGFVQGVSPAWRSHVLLLSTLNSCVDPLVYYFSSSHFQADFQSLLWRLTGGRVPLGVTSGLELKRKGGGGQRQA
ncbi:free fatty acid receptor 1 [Thomomys bottae]